MGILSGGGVDCAKLGDENYNGRNETGEWQRVAAFRDWLDSVIFQETEPSKERILTQCPSVCLKVMETGESGPPGSRVPRPAEGFSREFASVTIPSLGMEERSAAETINNPETVILVSPRLLDPPQNPRFKVQKY